MSSRPGPITNFAGRDIDPQIGDDKQYYCQYYFETSLTTNIIIIYHNIADTPFQMQ